MDSVSIVITSYNSREFIAQALESCLQQKGDLSIQVIVVDDCSTDGTWELLVKTTKNKSIELIRTKQNLGPSTCRNLGIKAAKGKYISFLDGDDYLLPGKLAKEIELLKKHPKLVGVFCDSKIEKRDGISSITLKDVSRVSSKNEDFLAHLLLTNCIALHAVLLKASAAKNILFDESLRRAEDYDFWLRVVIAYGPLVYLDEPLVVYRKVKGGLSSQITKTIDDNIIVLDKINAATLSSEQQTNLEKQKDGLLRTGAHLRLKYFNRDGFSYLQQASDLHPLPKSQRLALSLSKKSKTGAMLVYNVISIMLYIKRVPGAFGSRSKIVREFNR